MARCHKHDMSNNRATRDRLLGHQLASHEFDKDIIGKPLNIPEVNFTIPLEKKIQAVSGPPYYAIRARQIEQLTEHLMEDLTVQYRNMMDKFSDRPEIFASKWKESIKSVELDSLNDLIERHNKYYPIETNLPIDPRSGALMFGCARWEPKDKVTTDSLLQLFPVDTAVDPH